MFSGQVEINAGDGARKPAHHAFAERIWRDAAPIGDTLATAYLEARGIRAVSRAIRFHPRPPLGPRGHTQYMTAMIVAVTMEQRLVAVLCIPLNPTRRAFSPFITTMITHRRLGTGPYRLFDPEQ